MGAARSPVTEVFPSCNGLKSFLFLQSGVEDGDIYDGGWCARDRDNKQWLQVDALRLTGFTGVILQGRSSIWRSASLALP